VITDLFSCRDGRFIKVGEQWLGAFPDGLVIIKKVEHDPFGYQVEARVFPLSAVDVSRPTGMAARSCSSATEVTRTK
jgi:hypothetical protein